MRLSVGSLTCPQLACLPQYPLCSSSLTNTSSCLCYCPQNFQQKLTLTSAQLENNRIHTKEQHLEAPKVCSPQGARPNFLTNSMLYFVTQTPEEACLDQSLIKSGLNSICWLLWLAANHSTKTQSTGTCKSVQWDAGTFQKEDVSWCLHIYLTKSYLITTVFEPWPMLPWGMQESDQNISILFSISTHIMAVPKHSYMWHWFTMDAVILNWRNVSPKRKGKVCTNFRCLPGNSNQKTCPFSNLTASFYPHNIQSHISSNQKTIFNKRH